ncbi:MAG TPA: efflux transporter outer membrane subunit [Rhodocyclaceae bacterium]|jgi:NodT family efflux transporter outer membrane factor (OMF) lipoprotein
MRNPLHFCVETVLVALVLTGCAVGPDFQRPEAPKAEGYTATPLENGVLAGSRLEGDQQRFELGRDISAQWWSLFQSPALNSLIEKVFAANPDIEAAQAALRQAQENVEAQRGFFYPTVQASYSPSRTKLSANTSNASAPGLQGNGSSISASPGNPVIYNYHTAQLSVGFAPDVFGGGRRQLESSQAQAEAQRYVLEASYITLATNVVAAAIQEASLRAQIDAVKRIVVLNSQSLEILRRQYKAGYASALDVATQETAVAQAEQLLPPLTRQFEQTRDLIRILAGNTPDHDVSETFDLESLHLPEALPLSLPVQLVQQRPDIRAAEEQLHYASAQVGVAVANRWPQLSLTASMGGEASHFNQMFWDSGKFFSIIGSISQTIFDGGTLRHRQRAAEEGLVQAEAQYRSTVLSAFQNVADTLHALQGDAESVQAALRSEQAARKSFDLVRKQHEQGYVNALALYTAEQAYLQTSLTSVQAKANRLGDTAALFQVLGGGWWNKNEKTAAAETEIH